MIENLLMKLLQLLLLSIVFFSCGTNKIHYVRTVVEPIPVSENRQAENHATKVLENGHFEEPATSDFQPIVKSEIDKSETTSPTNKTTIKEEPSDDNSDKIRAALIAERQAKTSRNQLITSTALLPVSVIFPPLFLLALIFFVIGAVKFSRATQSRYITPDGEHYISGARIFLLISSIIITLYILLTAAILIIWFI